MGPLQWPHVRLSALTHAPVHSFPGMSVTASDSLLTGITDKGAGLFVCEMTLHENQSISLGCCLSLSIAHSERSYLLGCEVHSEETHMARNWGLPLKARKSTMALSPAALGACPASHHRVSLRAAHPCGSPEIRLSSSWLLGCSNVRDCARGCNYAWPDF